MTRAPVVDQRYRLRPEDLGGRSLTATVSNVTLQGLEQMQPVLHFTRIDKRLPLDDEQCDAMARCTGQAILEAWIGRRITLTPEAGDDGPTIRITAPDAAATESAGLPTVRAEARWSWRQPLLLILLLALAYFAVYLLDNGAQLWLDIQQLLTAIE
ncbi:MAG: hypothetical protein H6642_03735 [Caldilineaceae bacterium]|nr:hypothetical protein [Caldilineaceae bacterium]